MNRSMEPGRGRAAVELAACVRAGDCTAVDIVRVHLDKVAAHEAELRAWAFLDDDLALRAAADVDAALAAGELRDAPLAGVPIGVKDIIDVAGMPTANGAAITSDGPAERDAGVVARLRAAGAVPIGKTVTTEFALFQPGPTRNPHDPTRTPGGSSSGSAAAVAAGTVPLAIATQTAGSVVRPASFCGVFGAKPSAGRLPRDGVTLCSPSLDTVGLLGREVTDVTVGLTVMAGRPAAVADAPGRALRFGFTRTFEWHLLEASTRQLLEAAVERISHHLDVAEVTLPEAMIGLAEAQQTVMAVECADALAPIRAVHGERFSDALHAFLELGAARRWAYDAALAHASTGRAALGAAFLDVDVLLAPSVLGEAPAIDTTGDPLPCRQWTLLGAPTVAVPGLTGPSGLPLGIQVIAPVGEDARALQAAAALAALLEG